MMLERPKSNQSFTVYIDGKAAMFEPNELRVIEPIAILRESTFLPKYTPEPPRLREKQRAYNMMRGKKHLHRHQWNIPIKDIEIKTNSWI